MSRDGRSTVSRHPDRAAIERALAAGTPLRALTRKYGLSKDALSRHRQKLPEALRTKLAAQALRPHSDLETLRISESENLLGNLAAQRARLLAAQDKAIATDQLGLTAQLAGQIHRNLELVGKYLGEFASHQVKATINIVMTEEYLRLRAALIEALRRHPEARAEVASALRRIEAEAAQRMAAATPGPVINGAAQELPNDAGRF